MININELKSIIIQNALSGNLSKSIKPVDTTAFLTKEKIEFTIDGPYSIPDHWSWVKCKDVCTLLGGFAFKSERYSKTNDGVRVIRISDFNNAGIIYDDIKRYPYDKMLDPYEIFENDILMCMTGGTVGKSCLFPKVADKCFLNQRVALFRTKYLEVKYLYYVLKSTQILKIINDTKRSTNDNISMKIIGSFDIPFPPVEEQKRIVTKLDEIFAELDKIDEMQNRLQSIQEKMESKILKLAIQGKLVEQRPEEGTGEELFELVQKEKQLLIKEGKIKKEKPLPSIEESEIPFEIPSTWKWVRLNSIVEINPKSSLEENMNVGFIPMALVDGGYANSHTYEIKKWKDVKKGFNHFKNDDIVVAKITPCFENKKSCIIKNLPNGYGSGTTELNVVRVIENMIINKYLLFIFKTDEFIKEGILSFNSIVGQQRLEKDFLASYLIPLPPLEEQKRIVAKIEELLPLCRGN